MTKIVYRIPVGSYEAANRGKALRERAHDKVNIILQAEVVANATSTFTEHAKAMSLVDHD